MIPLLVFLASDPPCTRPVYDIPPVIVTSPRAPMLVRVASRIFRRGSGLRIDLRRAGRV